MKIFEVVHGYYAIIMAESREQAVDLFDEEVYDTDYSQDDILYGSASDGHCVELDEESAIMYIKMGIEDCDLEEKTEDEIKNMLKVSKPTLILVENEDFSFENGWEKIN